MKAIQFELQQIRDNGQGILDLPPLNLYNVVPSFFYPFVHLFICSLIRHDSVEEFISYVNHINYPLSSQILPSVFETYSFLIDNNNTALIEYSAFFGSIQIFLYLQIIHKIQNLFIFLNQTNFHHRMIIM